MIEEIRRLRRSIDRAVLMHGTSGARLDAARLLARVARESGARGASYGWRDAPPRSAPIHAAAGAPLHRWEASLPRGFAERLERPRESRWDLVIHGVGWPRPQRSRPLLELAAKALQAAELHDRPRIPEDATRGSEGRFVALLEALRFASFSIPRPASVPYLRNELRRASAGLPPIAREAAERAADAVDDLERLPRALLALGRALDQSGRLSASAAVHVILYEITLLRCDLETGVDAAHGAGRAFRRMANWHEAFRWYQLGLRLAEHDGDFLRAARLLDGLGNTHRERGSFPSARRCYQDAWRLAVVASDPVEIGNVALGLMTVEREAGRLDQAARVGWRALKSQHDPRQRVNLLLNLGTLFRDGGDVELARDTYRLVWHAADDPELRVMAQDALAHCAALCGSAAEYGRLVSEVRRAARAVSPYVRAQVGYYRGASLRALGDERATRVLRATERFARARGLTEWEIRAARMAEQPISGRPPAVAMVRPSDEVRAGISALLESLETPGPIEV